MTDRIQTIMSAADVFSVVSDTNDILSSTVSACKTKPCTQQSDLMQYA